jgi:hypothetical protein
MFSRKFISSMRVSMGSTRVNRGTASAFLCRMYYLQIMHSGDPPVPSVCHHGDLMRSAKRDNKMIYPHPRSPPARV